MNSSWISVWSGPLVLAQAEPTAGAATAAAPQAVNAVGVPGASQGVPAGTALPATTGGTSQPLPANSTTQPGGLGPMIWMIPVLLLVMVGMSTLTGRKDKKKRADLMASLKKHDKVQMVGGEIGVITELTDEEVVIRVEEGRIRFSRASVQVVLTPSKAKAESGSLAEVKGEPKAASV